MKKIPTHTPARLILLFAACLGCATAAPFGPEGKETTFVQPGGEVLKLRVYGDEHYGRAENASGHTVVYNPQDGAYHYANVSADG